MAKIEFPEKYTDLINTMIGSAGFDLSRPQQLASAIKKLSDMYIDRQIPKDIWASAELSAAYLSYFFPLNYLRIKRVIQATHQMNYHRLFTEVIDMGSGCGTFIWAFLDTVPEARNYRFTSMDNSKKAAAWGEQIKSELFQGLDIKFTQQLPKIENNHLLSLSYALNELPESNKLLQKADHLLIIEPSLQKVSRHLMQLRQQLIDKHYYAWAPCTHQGGCPLLVHSKKDWCHDRIMIDLPEWLRNIEEHLPMKNRSVTFSYLALSKTKAKSLSYGRVIGDTLKENGKARQALCRDDQRQFLSWLQRKGEPQAIPRGYLVDIGENYEKKGNELRPNHLVRVLGPETIVES